MSAMKAVMTSALLALIAVGSHALSATGDSPVTFPEGYESWTRVKTKLTGAGSKSHATDGGFHHFYANAKAVEGYRSGVFPDGAMLIDDRLEAVEKDGIFNEGSRVHVAVMVKDSARFAASNNWGFEVFTRGVRTGTLDAAAKGACLACHQRAPRDLVFTALR